MLSLFGRLIFCLLRRKKRDWCVRARVNNRSRERDNTKTKESFIHQSTLLESSVRPHRRASEAIAQLTVAIFLYRSVWQRRTNIDNGKCINASKDSTSIGWNDWAMRKRMSHWTVPPSFLSSSLSAPSYARFSRYILKLASAHTQTHTSTRVCLGWPTTMKIWRPLSSKYRKFCFPLHNLVRFVR